MKDPDFFLDGCISANLQFRLLNKTKHITEWSYNRSAGRGVTYIKNLEIVHLDEQ